jgi:hypothetical protein
MQAREAEEQQQLQAQLEEEDRVQRKRQRKEHKREVQVSAQCVKYGVEALKTVQAFENGTVFVNGTGVSGKKGRSTRGRCRSVLRVGSME